MLYYVYPIRSLCITVQTSVLYSVTEDRALTFIVLKHKKSILLHTLLFKQLARTSFRKEKCLQLSTQAAINTSSLLGLAPHIT